MATLGYEPKINLDSIKKPKVIDSETKHLLYKIGVTGFCAGNIMMMSFPEYFNLNSKMTFLFSGFSYISISFYHFLFSFTVPAIILKVHIIVFQKI